jgi:hypothetical protein
MEEVISVAGGEESGFLSMSLSELRSSAGSPERELKILVNN